MLCLPRKPEPSTAVYRRASYARTLVASQISPYPSPPKCKGVSSWAARTMVVLGRLRHQRPVDKGHVDPQQGRLGSVAMSAGVRPAIGGRAPVTASRAVDPVSLTLVILRSRRGRLGWENRPGIRGGSAMEPRAGSSQPLGALFRGPLQRAPDCAVNDVQGVRLLGRRQ